MSAEQIYNIIPDEPDDDKSGTGDGMGDVEDADGKDESSKTAKEDEMKVSLSQALIAAKDQGNLPGSLRRLIQEVLQPKVDWQEVLARFLTEVERNDYTFKKPNPRYIQSGFYLPYLENQTIGEIVLIVDTSGSITEEIINKFGTEMQQITNTFNKGFKVLYVDAKFQGEQDIEPDGDVKLEPLGGGGTDFKPGFKYIEEQGISPKAVVYFTDMVCTSFPEEPEYPVLWVEYGTGGFEAPFGEVLKIDEL
jgi:predicted metal-dependent peptidase